LARDFAMFGFEIHDTATIDRSGSCHASFRRCTPVQRWRGLAAQDRYGADECEKQIVAESRAEA